MGCHTACARKWPVSDTFEQKGMEVMQVVHQCSVNYQQTQWDEESTL